MRTRRIEIRNLGMRLKDSSSLVQTCSDRPIQITSACGRNLRKKIVKLSKRCKKLSELKWRVRSWHRKLLRRSDC